jgi:hypothetical protein
VEFQQLREQFTVLQTEHEYLKRHPLLIAEHRQHLARLRTFVDTLHAWHDRAARQRDSPQG